MVWRRYRPNSAVWNEFNELMQEMENQLSSLMEEVETTPLLPAREFRGRLIPAIRGDLRVDVREHDDEVVVVADLPGVEKTDLSVSLVNPGMLEIRSERRAEKEEKEEGYVMRERMSGAMSRIVTLPHDVTDAGASATFKNGVLEIRLKKSTTERGSPINVE